MTTTPKELVDRFPYMFNGKHIGISIARGWMPLFENLCVQIDAILGEDKLGFHWRQVKEKFGSGRFYWKANLYEPVSIDLIGPDGVLCLQGAEVHEDPLVNDRLDQIRKLVSEVSQATSEVCIACGKSPAKATVNNGYYLVLCAEHATKWQHGADLSSGIWFDLSEDVP